jgi:hypothetical protein
MDAGNDWYKVPCNTKNDVSFSLNDCSENQSNLIKSICESIDKYGYIIETESGELLEIK